jgi:hypothetical protein
MVSLTIEAILIAAGILPLIITTPRPTQALNRTYCGRQGNARRSD